VSAWDGLSLDDRLSFGLPRLGLAVKCEAVVRLGADRGETLRWALALLGSVETRSALASFACHDYRGGALHAAAAAQYFALIGLER
jgi:hypothetical protein